MPANARAINNLSTIFYQVNIGFCFCVLLKKTKVNHEGLLSEAISIFSFIYFF
jgi:hypothetical protein